MVSTMESQVESKLPINLQVTGIAREATLTVLISFMEIRDCQDSVGPVQNSTGGRREVKGLTHNGSVYNRKEKKKQLSQEELSLGDSDESVNLQLEGCSETSLVTELGSSSDSIQLDPVKKVGFFSWKRRRLSFIRPARTKVEPLTRKSSDENTIDLDPQSTGSYSIDSTIAGSTKKPDAIGPSSESDHQGETSTTCDWEMKEIFSRDSQTKLKASVFFASFDQRSDEAAGESACTALVAVIAHWLQSNQHETPTKSQFDSLIIQGSSEWRKLCDKDAHKNHFPNKHFDLETVLNADLRPVAVLPQKSFVGFFGAEKFEALKGAMSFDEIWNEIDRNIGENDGPRVYIVSWNDHFFVLKVEDKAYYIIDTLGERLFEGCNQAFVLKFDDSALMHEIKEREKIRRENGGPEEESDEMICSGKECCREFIKRFLAAIPLRELEEEEKKEAVSYFSLHQRLQIEFNFSYSLCSLSSSSPSSQFSGSVSSSTSSHFSNELCI
ncbi:unnamed protein product [Ilex paraguariensis]